MAKKIVENMFNMNDNKTAKINKRFERKGSRYSLHKEADATLESKINFADIVKLPPDEELEDFIAFHVVDFYNRAKGTAKIIVSTYAKAETRTCTEENCPGMTGGPKYEYLWQDDVKHKKAVSLPAPEYILTLLEWTADIIADESIFPVTEDIPFPKNFKKTCSKILRRLYRIFVHVYIEHFDRLREIEAEAHTNTFYKHFYYFVREHNMLEEKDYAPLEALTARICTD